MPASIRMNGLPTPNESYAIGGTVSLTNADNTGVSTWAWTLLSKPAGSAAALTTPTASSSSFVADLEGSYRIRLVTNDGSALAVARVRSTHVSLALFAKDETSEGDATEGWAKAWRDNNQALDKRMGIPTNRRTVRYVGTAASGPLILSATGAVVTLPNGDIVPAVDRLNPGTSNEAVFLWDGGALTANQDVRVVAWGMSNEVANPDTMVAGDLVSFGTAGVLRKTFPSGDSVQAVGYCLNVNGGNIRVWVEPRDRTNTSTNPASVAANNVGAAGTSRAVARADHVHGLATFGGTPAPLGTASAGVNGTAPSRGDHVHAHGDLAGGTLHALATVAANGFMSADDKDKVNDAVDRNLLLNGGFNWWQRTNPITGAQLNRSESAIGFYDSLHALGPFAPDRWCFQAHKLAAGVQTLTCQSSGVGLTLTADTVSSTALRLRNSVSSSNVRYQMVQEIRDLASVRGKQITWALKARKGAAFVNAASLRVHIVANTGLSSQRFKNFSAPVDIDIETFSGTVLTTSWATYAASSPTVVPVTATCLAFIISFETSGSPGTVNDYLDVTDVVLSTGGAGADARTPVFYQPPIYEELDELERFFQKGTFSWFPTIAPTAPPTFALVHIGTNDFLFVDVPFRRTMAQFVDSVSVYSAVNNTLSNVYLDVEATDKGITGLTADLTRFFFGLVDFSGVSNTQTVSFYWAADAEIRT